MTDAPDAVPADASASAADGPELVDAASMAGVPDEFQRLWTPHRMAYISAGREPMEKNCPFCAAPDKSDEDGLIVARGRTAYVLLNLFPYNSGHLLVCPYRHIATYDQATDDEVAEIGALTQRGMRVLRAVSNCDGFNLGMNQGAIAGEQDRSNGTVSFRFRDGTQLNGIPVEEAVARITGAIAQRTLVNTAEDLA